jgi:hypothetical protein
MSLRGHLLRLSYQLDRHYGGPLSVGRWIVVIGLGIALIGLLPRVRWSLAVVSAAGAIALLTMILLIWGRATRYHHFRPAAPAGAPAEPCAIKGSDHVKARASGLFSVEGREQFFADLEALYHSFETREHAVMAFVPFSRFLLGGSRPEQKGMWYIFWQPAQIERIEAGNMEHGARRRPALRIAYRAEKKTEFVCLAFASEADMRKAEADLRFDLPAPGSDTKKEKP